METSQCLINDHNNNNRSDRSYDEWMKEYSEWNENGPGTSYFLVENNNFLTRKK